MRSRNTALIGSVLSLVMVAVPTAGATPSPAPTPSASMPILANDPLGSVESAVASLKLLDFRMRLQKRDKAWSGEQERRGRAEVYGTRVRLDTRVSVRIEPARGPIAEVTLNLDSPTNATGDWATDLFADTLLLFIPQEVAPLIAGCFEPEVMEAELLIDLGDRGVLCDGSTLLTGSYRVQIRPGTPGRPVPIPTPQPPSPTFSPENPTIDLYGSVILSESPLSSTLVPTTDGCTGGGAFADIGEGLDVVVRDASDSIVGVGALGEGEPATPPWTFDYHAKCRFPFVVPDIPQSDFYTLMIGARSAGSYSLSELEALRWVIDIEDGD